jgi:hypothetical protein
MSILLVPSGPSHNVPTVLLRDLQEQRGGHRILWRGGSSKDPGLVDAELIAAGLTQANATPDQLRDIEEERYYSEGTGASLECALFLLGSDRNLENDNTQGKDSYPVHSPTGIPPPPRALEAGSPE